MAKRRFFYDTEFIERPPLGAVPGTIDLISIGIIDEDGSQIFYGCCIDADYSQANAWVRVNVLNKLPEVNPIMLGATGLSVCHPWYTRAALAAAVLDFLQTSAEDSVELWGYYSSYDHVALCWLFGAMIDLPEGMPMYTHDVKQLCDAMGNPRLPKQPEEAAHDAKYDAMWVRQAWLHLQQLKEIS